MIFTLEALPAKEGDCLLLHWGTRTDFHLAVIDGGPGRVFDDHLQPRLEAIRSKRGLAQLLVDLVMVSHVDNDHIIGVKKLFEMLKGQFTRNLPPEERRIRVRRLWHNTFNDILNDASDEYYKSATAALTASVGEEPNPQLVQRLAGLFAQKYAIAADEAHALAEDVGLILAGHNEGRTLRDLHGFLREKNEIAALNYPFKASSGKATLISARDTPDPIDLAGIKVTVVGPLAKDIEALQKEFDKYLKKHGLGVEAMLAAYADDKVPNLSSIVCVVQNGSRRILLTGDARGDKILEGLSQAGMLSGGKARFDVLKVPHHGSARNLAQDFFDKIAADTYLISASGKYANPDRESIEWLIASRSKDDSYDIVLTYGVDVIDQSRKKEIERKRPWKEDSDSLSVLFKQKRNEGYRFNVKDSAPVTLDLGDEKVAW